LRSTRCARFGAFTLLLLFTCLFEAPSLHAAIDPIRINCGNRGGPEVGPNGSTWIPDQYYKGGDVVYNGGYDPDFRRLFGMARYGLYGNFSYFIPAPAGDYTVNLYFAELQVDFPGQRVFNVAINGQAALNNYDILAEVSPLVMTKKSFSAASSKVVIQIDFTGVTRFATVSAIEILPKTTAPAPTISMTPTTGNVAPGQSLQFTASVQNSTSAVVWSVSPTSLGSVTSTGKLTSSLSITTATAGKVRAALQSNPTIFAEAGMTVTPAGGSTTATTVLRINTGNGSETYTDPNGNKWQPDQWYAGGDIFSNMELPVDVRRLLGIARQGLYTNFGYRIPIAPGTYKVALNFVELSLTVPGHRVFNVRINGALVLPNFDILAQAEPEKTLQKVFTVNAPSGLIEIEFEGIKRFGTISAIEIVPSTASVSAPLNASGAPPVVTPPPTNGGGGTTTPALLANPTSMSFSMTQGGSNPAGKSVGVYTNPTASVDWTVRSLNTDFISVNPGSGKTTGAFSVTVSGAGKAAGTYNGAVEVAATGVTGSPIRIPVSLAIAPTTTTTNPPTTPTPLPTGGNQWFAAPNGTKTGDGSISKPWDLKTALAHPAVVKPGDTIWVRGGTYPGLYDSLLKGTISKPIIVRNYNGERATIDTGNRTGGAALEVYGQDAWYWGLEIMSSNPNRKTGTTGSSGGARLGLMDGVDTFGIRCKFINLIVHDTRQGYGFWEYGIDNEIYGNLIYYNGWAGGDRGHGHAIYSQNRTGVKVIENNIQFKGYAMGLRAIGSELAAAKGYRFLKNISFESGALYGNKWTNLAIAVGSGAQDIQVDDTYTYHNTAVNDGSSWLGWTGSGRQKDVRAHRNYWVGGESVVNVEWWDKVEYTDNFHYNTTSFQVDLDVCCGQQTSTYTWRNNRYFGVDRFRYEDRNYPFANWKSLTGLDAGSTFTTGRPTGTEVFVLPNKYEPGRAHIAVYNWGLQNTVAANVSSVLQSGDRFEVRDAENYFGAPVLTGTYNGSAINLPMNLTAIAQPSGAARVAPVHTGKEFNAFVLIKTN
jgi:hypothetical protein